MQQDTLGLWTMVLLNGKGTTKTRLISMCSPHKKGGPLSTISQDRLHYLTKGKMRHPHDVFWKDLTMQFKQWKENGEQTIIGGDWNKDTTEGITKKQCEETNLKNPQKISILNTQLHDTPERKQSTLH